MSELAPDPPLLKQILSFLGVGGLATITHYLCALLVVEGLGSDVFLGNLIGYLCAVGISYLGHSLLTFKHALSTKVMLRFTAASLTTLGLSQLVLYLMVNHVALQPRLSMAGAVLYTVAQSYLVNRFWVYRVA